MKKSRFREEQMVTILREADRRPVPEVAKQHGVSAQTIYSWRKHFGTLEPADVKRLRQLEQENGRLKKMVADRDLEIDVLKEITRKNGVYPGFPTLFWGLSVFFVGDLMGKALWKLVENAARFPRRGGRVLCVHGAVSFHRARPCGPRWLPGRGAMRHVELDRRVLGLQSTGE